MIVGVLIKGFFNWILIVEMIKWKGIWGVFGGKVDWGESLEVVVVWEFIEEVGLKLINICFVMFYEVILDL